MKGWGRWVYVWRMSEGMGRWVCVWRMSAGMGEMGVCEEDE